jgi:hypothetical protein
VENAMTNIPTTATEFAKWRKKQNFATDEMNQMANHVMLDLQMLEKIDAAPEGSNNGFVQLRATIAKTRAEFEAALASVR